MTDPTRNGFDDPLEQELADLRPVGLPARVQRGVATALASPRIRRHSLVLRLSAAGMAMAACITVVVLIARHRDEPQVTRGNPTTPGTQFVEAETPPAPTLGDLRLALARSPEAAETLLTGRGTARPAPAKPVRAFGPVALGAWPAGPTY
jgi:hypothetical protein